jgi:hypothetical protein
MMEFVSWDDDIPNIRKNKSHIPNHHPVSMNSHRFSVDVRNLAKYDDFQGSSVAEDMVLIMGQPYQVLAGIPTMFGCVACWWYTYPSEKYEFGKIDGFL